MLALLQLHRHQRRHLRHLRALTQEAQRQALAAQETGVDLQKKRDRPFLVPTGRLSPEPGADGFSADSTSAVTLLNGGEGIALCVQAHLSLHVPSPTLTLTSPELVLAPRERARARCVWRTAPTEGVSCSTEPEGNVSPSICCRISYEGIDHRRYSACFLYHARGVWSFTDVVEYPATCGTTLFVPAPSEYARETLPNIQSYQKKQGK
jgi:hypothetical protein